MRANTATPVSGPALDPVAASPTDVADADAGELGSAVVAAVVGGSEAGVVDAGTELDGGARTWMVTVAVTDAHGCVNALTVMCG